MSVQFGLLLAWAAASSQSGSAAPDVIAQRDLIRRCENAAVVVVDAYVREPTDDIARVPLVRERNASFRPGASNTDPRDAEIMAAYASVALQLPELSAEEKVAPFSAATQVKLAARAGAVCVAVAAASKGAP